MTGICPVCRRPVWATRIRWLVAAHQDAASRWCPASGHPWKITQGER